MEVKEKKSVGRPRKYLDTKKVYTWFDESEYSKAKAQLKVWEEAYEKCKAITGSEFESLEEYEDKLRKRHPELDKLEIGQLYILEGNDRLDFKKAFRDLKAISKPSVKREDFEVKIPVERAEEYSRYLSIANNFNEIRKSDTTVNVMVLPGITNNKVVFDIRLGKLIPNAYLFTQSFK